jgi:hypothetical protein
MKELSFFECKLCSLTFIEKFTNLNSVELNACEVPNLISPFYTSIGKLDQMKALSLVNLKSRTFEKDLQL